MYAEYCFEEKIDITKTAKNDEKTFIKIAKMLNALMNTSGGLLVLQCGKSAVSSMHKKTDIWLQAFKAFVTEHWISRFMYRLLVTSDFVDINEQLYLFFFVEKWKKRIIYSIAYQRHRNGKDRITSEEELKRLMQKPVKEKQKTPRSQLTDRLMGNSSIILGPENETMEYKHYSIKEFRAREIIKKLRTELRENISAFANHKGGSLVIGVEDKEGTVIGYPVTGNQQEAEDEKTNLTEYINKTLRECIWNGEKPDSDTCYWDVFYHDVKSDKQTDHRLIEIAVNQIRGGMLLELPVYYTVDIDATNQSSRLKKNPVELEEWTLRPQYNNGDNDDRLEKHVMKVNNSEKIETQQRKVIKGQERIETNKIVEELNKPNIIHNAKTHKSFRESNSEYKTDVEVKMLSSHACCINDMIKNYLTGEHIWFPSIKSTLKSAPPICEKIFEHIDQQKWEGIASAIVTQPEFHTSIANSVCDVLMISKYGSPKLFSCFKTGEFSDADKTEYALEFGRRLKNQFLHSMFNAELLPLHFHFDVQVLTLLENGSVSISWNSFDKQPVRYPDQDYQDQSQYHVACTGLAERLLQPDHPLKNCRGQVLMEHLTDEQARLIVDRKETILIIWGRSGTGKTAVALSMIKEAKVSPEKILYICASVGVQSWVESQELCKVWNINRTDSLSGDQKSALKSCDLLVVDDAHAIVPGKHWEEDDNDLYKLLFTHSANTRAEVVIFLDPIQDFKDQIPENFQEKLRTLAVKVTKNILLPEKIQIYTLTKRIRNSRGIQNFMQANQNQAEFEEEVECLNARDGDDVTYSYVGSRIEDVARSVDKILHSLTRRYDRNSIVILSDDNEQLQKIPQKLKKDFRRAIQNPRTFPIKDTVMCKLEEFGGLEADVILFLLPPTWGLGCVGNWKYIYNVTSRAIQRLEFLLPWDPSENQQRQEKLEYFLELFKTVSTGTNTCHFCNDSKYAHELLQVSRVEGGDKP